MEASGGDNMKYNFDEVHDRSDNQSVKYDELEKIYGTRDLLSMWVADMDFKTAEPIIEALRDRVNQGIFGYTAVAPEYKRSIVDWCKRRHGWKLDEDWLLYSPGVVPTLSLIIQNFTEKGDKVIIQPPVYGPFERVVIDNDRQLVLNPLIKDETGYYTMDFDHLEKKIDQGAKVLILCNPHNPVGRVWKIDELEKLAEIVVRRNIRVISDEIHSDIILKGNKHIPFASINSEVEKMAITCMAPTKTFNLAGLQTSMVILPNKEDHDILSNAFGIIDMVRNNCFGQVATIAAYNDGEEWLDQLLGYIEGNMDFLVDYMNKNIPSIKVLKPEGTYLVWLDFNSLGYDNKELKEFMIREAKVALTDGGFFGFGGDGFMRINLATPRSKVVECVERINRAIDKM